MLFISLSSACRSQSVIVSTVHPKLWFSIDPNYSAVLLPTQNVGPLARALLVHRSLIKVLPYMVCRIHALGQV